MRGVRLWKKASVTRGLSGRRGRLLSLEAGQGDQRGQFGFVKTGVATRFEIERTA
jgi:hypothetical protein